MPLRRFLMRTRLVVAAALAVLAAAGPVSAAPTKKPQIVDAPGDAIGGQAGTEIVSVLWTTTGDTTVTRVKGKKKTVYQPRKLVVTMNLKGAPFTQPPFAYETSAEFAGCGTIRFTYTPGTVFGQLLGPASLWYDCGDPDPTTGDTLELVPNPTHKIGAKSITWEYPIKAFPKVVKAGVLVTEFRAAVDVVEPVFGLQGTTDTGTPIDGATSDAAWKLGS